MSDIQYITFHDVPEGNVPSIRLTITRDNELYGATASSIQKGVLVSIAGCSSVGKATAIDAVVDVLTILKNSQTHIPNNIALLIVPDMVTDVSLKDQLVNLDIPYNHEFTNL
ncbi:hypothetical protein ACSBQS_05770 [Serratia sp. H402Y]|uniref:hypothetical protein n=1 Tax=Serratia sp. H402Y TaxID=3444320 RepID=UPI003383EA5A